MNYTQCLVELTFMTYYKVDYKKHNILVFQLSYFLVHIEHRLPRQTGDGHVCNSIGDNFVIELINTLFFYFMKINRKIKL